MHIIILEKLEDSKDILECCSKIQFKHHFQNKTKQKSMGNSNRSRKKYTDSQKQEIRRLYASLRTGFDETSGTCVFFFGYSQENHQHTHTHTDSHLQLLRCTWRAMHPEREFQRKDVRWKSIGFQGVRYVSIRIHISHVFIKGQYYRRIRKRTFEQVVCWP